MPKRQIAIIVLTVLVVLYGAYTYLLEPVLSHKQLPTLNTEEVQAAIDSIRAEMAKSRPAPLVMYRLELAMGEMPETPFYASNGETEEAVPQEKSGTGPAFTYGGFVEMDGVRLAIINGLDYMPGEELAEAGYYVTSVERNKVVIEKRSQDQKVLERITAPLTDDFAVVSEEKNEQAPAEQ